MEMLNNAFADADAFKKMLEKVETPTRRTEIVSQCVEGENRKQRRARERTERKAYRKAAANAD